MPCRSMVMESKKIQQFAHWSYEYHRAKKKFDSFLIGSLMNGLVILGLLIVDFYQIPYVFEGILPILINLGFILLPIFLLATLVWRFHLKSAEEEYDLARLAMLEDVYERIKKLKD